jgi:hypothetical protein
MQKPTKAIALSIALLSACFNPTPAQGALIYTNFTIPANSPNVGEFSISSSALWELSQLSNPGPWDYRYAYQSFRVNETGLYTMGMTDGIFDALMILYAGTTTFPADPSTGAVALVDDGDWDYNSTTGLYYFDTQTLNPFAVPNSSGGYNPSWLPMIKQQNLVAGMDYLIAISTFSPQTNNSEPYTSLPPVATFSLPSSFFIGGPAGVTLYGGESAAVPEPGQVAASLLLLTGIGGYVWLKRRKVAKPA